MLQVVLKSSTLRYCAGRFALVAVLLVVIPILAQAQPSADLYSGSQIDAQATLDGAAPYEAPSIQAEIPLSEILREDGTLDLQRTFEGSVDLSGFSVHMEAGGTIRAVAEGGQWLPGEQPPGTNGIVHVLEWGPDGALYVGGEFSSAGGISSTSRIARWTPDETGGAWSALGEGMLNNSVSALTWGPDGALYAGGSFFLASGVSGTNSIARWTPDGAGGAWSALGEGVNIAVWALAWGPDGALYVGGSGAVSENRIARWTPDGTPTGGEWSALGAGVSPTVFALAWGPDGALYVGGSFVSAGGVSGTSNIARWTPDGTGAGGEWSALGSGVNNNVWALAWGPDGALYVGGFFTSAGGVGADRIARWTPDGTGGAWSTLGAGANGTVVALAWGPDGALYVGGNFTSAGGVSGTIRIARWTPSGAGGTWSAVDSGVNDTVYAFAWGPGGALYTGGYFTSAGGLSVHHIARWTPDGSIGAWSALGLGINDTVYALAWGSDGALYAGGGFTSAGGVSGADRIARWMPSGAGGNWSALGSGVNNDVYTLAWGPDGALYVGGSFISAGGVSGTSNIARWTPDETGAGGEWSALGSGVNNNVWALAWGPDGALYVGGFFTSAGGASGTSRIARWTPDGTPMGGNWSALGSGVNATVREIAWGPDGALYAGGWFISAGGVQVNRIARWTPDGSGTGGAWSALGSGVNSLVYAIVWGPDGSLYAGGWFTSASGVSGTNYIARWTPDGSGTGGVWSALGSGVNNTVRALAWGPDGALYAGGAFTSASGVSGTSRIARWTPDSEGGAWSALGSGVNNNVWALAWDPGNLLFVGGEFTSAGGLPSSRFARWHDGPVTTDPGSMPQAFTLEGNYPNPFSATTRFGFVLSVAGPVRIEAFDLLGRSVAILLDDEAREAGRHEVVWDASALPAGVYVVRITSGEFSQSRRVVVVR